MTFVSSRLLSTIHAHTIQIILTSHVAFVGTAMAQVARVLRPRRHLEKRLHSLCRQIRGFRRPPFPRCIQTGRPAN